MNKISNNIWNCNWQIPKSVNIEINIKIINTVFNNIFPIPWHFLSSNAWNVPFNSPINDFKIISIEKSNVTVIAISSDFIIHKINNVIIILQIANIDFNGNNFDAES